MQKIVPDSRWCGSGMLASMRLKLLLAAAVTLSLSAAAQQSWDVWRSAIDEAFDVSPQLPPLAAKTWSTFSPAPGVLADRVTYATSSGMIVPAIVYRPDPKSAPYKGKLPGIIVVNGHGSDKFGWYAFYSGMMFAKAGAVVLTYDPIGEGERNAQRASMLSPSPHERDVTPPPPLPKEDWGRHVAGAMQDDLDQSLRYVASRPEVDATRIGVVGYSMGSFVAGVAGARHGQFQPIAPGQPGFHALVLSGGGVYDDGPGYFDFNKSLCQRAPYSTLGPLLSSNPTQRQRGFDIFFLNAMRGPTLVMNGLGDSVMGIPQRDPQWFEIMRQRLLKNCSNSSNGAIQCNNVFTHIEYPARISHRPSWVNRDGVHWLNAQLHFAFWNTDEKIDAQGTTHISAWITANHVDISPNYFREDREGGLDAVGTALPGIPRTALTVLPEADWQRLKDQLTYEAWAAKTTAAEQAAARAAVH
jgi:dienelactone hydrolase